MKIRRFLSWTFRLVLLAIVVLLAYGYFTSTNDCGKPPRSDAPLMRAYVHCTYGGPEVLQVQQLEKPTPNDDQMLVKVRAASLNPVDGHTMRDSVFIRLGNGLRVPKDIRFGTDYSGVIEAVGKNVTTFKPGDEVFGGKSGALADYLVARADRAVAAKPANITFEEAASVGVAGLTALQALRDKGNLQPGQRVLINGASGGVGTFAVQIAKAMGATVTGVCSTRNIDLARSLGADEVIDYTKDDFTKRPERYNLLFDNVQNHPFAERRSVLVPGGICVNVGIGGAGPHPGMLGKIAETFYSVLRSKFTDEKFKFFIAEFKQADLAYLAELMQSGKLKPVIDQTFPFEKAADALRYLEEGHARGKVVVKVSD